MSSKFYIQGFSDNDLVDGYSYNPTQARLDALEKKMFKIEKMINYLFLKETNPEEAAKMVAEIYGEK